MGRTQINRQKRRGRERKIADQLRKARRTGAVADWLAYTDMLDHHQRLSEREKVEEQKRGRRQDISRNCEKAEKRRGKL